MQRTNKHVFLTREYGVIHEVRAEGTVRKQAGAQQRSEVWLEVESLQSKMIVCQTVTCELL